MEVNNFLAGRRKPTPTDAVLAKCYYPMLCELAKHAQKATFKEFVDAAKKRYPNVEEVQNAIPVSTGRRFEYVRTYTNQHNLPDLSAWVVSQAGTNSDAYETDFDPQKEREESRKVNWDDYDGEWNEFVEKLTKATVQIKRRKKDEARKIMAQYAKELRAIIEANVPNPNKLKYATLVTPFADPLIESLMEGNEVEVAFDNIIFDLTQSSSASAAA